MFQCLEIIDVGCNLKEFDGLTRLTLTPILYDRSTPLINWKDSSLKHVDGKFNPTYHSLEPSSLECHCYEENICSTVFTTDWPILLTVPKVA